MAVYMTPMFADVIMYSHACRSEPERNRRRDMLYDLRNRRESMLFSIKRNQMGQADRWARR